MVDSVDLNIKDRNGRTTRTTVGGFVSKVFSVLFIFVGALMGGFIVIVQRTSMDGLIFIALAKME